MIDKKLNFFQFQLQKNQLNREIRFAENLTDFKVQRNIRLENNRQE